jgi:hypothetical protein
LFFRHSETGKGFHNLSLFPFFNKIFGFANYVPSLNALSIASKAFSGKALSLPSDCDLRAHGAAQATIHSIDFMLCSLDLSIMYWSHGTDFNSAVF